MDEGYEEYETNMEEIQKQYAMAQGHQIEMLDMQYNLVHTLDLDQIRAFMRIMAEIANIKPNTGQSLAAAWEGYARAIRYTKFGVNPNPMVPKVSDDLGDEGSPLND